MKGKKPNLDNVVPMKGDHTAPVPDPMDWMTPQGMDVWADLAPHLAAKHRLKPEFRYQFASYCEAVACFIESTNAIALEGRFYETKTRNGTQQKHTRAYAQQQQAMDQMRRDGALFGMSPIDEARLSGGPQGDLFDDVMAQLNAPE